MLFAACKKADFAQKSSLQNEERFFKLPANARPELKRIVEDLKIKNKIHPFNNEFIASEGYPLWEFAQFKKRKFNVTNRGDGNEQDSLVQVPIVQEEAQYVKDILNIRIDSSILYKLIAGEEYASFGFNKDPNRTTPNANDIVGTIMAYEHLIWGQNIFEITDNRLFDNWPQGAPKPDSFYVVQKFTTTYSTITWVCGFHTGGQLQSCPPGEEHCFELIPEICSITWVSTTYEGDGDSGEWEPIPPTITPGSSSGSGTGTNPTTKNPPNNLPTICGSGRGWVRIVPDIETGIWKNPCTGIPIPIEDEPQTLCEIAQNAAKKMDTLFNASKADSVLNTIPNLSTETKEKGFPIYQNIIINPFNPTDTSVTGYSCGAVQTGTDSSILIEYIYNPNTKRPITWLHTHNKNGYPAQSAKDIYELLADNLSNSNFQGAFVAAANGEQHAITITDPAKATAFLNTKSTYLDGTKWKEDSDIGKAFEKAYEAFEKKYKNYDTTTQRNLAYEMAMAAVLSEYYTGITLHKKDPATGKFKPLVVKTATPNPNKPKKKEYTQECL